MIIIQGVLCGIGIKRGRLYGDSPHDLVTIKFLLVHIVWICSQGAMLIRQAVTGLMQDPEWLVDNAPSVRLARRKARDYYRREHEKYMNDCEKRGVNERYELRSKIRDLENENTSLRNSLVALARGNEK